MTIIQHPTPYQAEGPQPLIGEVPEGQPYPVDALGPLQPAVQAVADMTGAPVAIPAQSALSVASLAVQGFADVETLAGYAPTSLYALTIAKSGERKSSCDGQFMRALRDHEKAQSAQRRDQMATWKNDVTLWKEKRESILSELKKKGGDKATAKADLDALGPEPAAPANGERTVSEPTIAGMSRFYIEGQPSGGLFSDEGGLFLGGHGMSKDNRQMTMAALNSLWDGSPIKRTRGGDGCVTLYGKRMALHLMAQPEVMNAVMADPLANGIGFLPRCLICFPSSAIGTRTSDRLKTDILPVSDFEKKLAVILQADLPMVDEATRELEPRKLPLSKAARALLVQYSDHVEKKQAKGAEFETVAGYASKSAEQACRIAGMLTLWENVKAAEVTPQTMAAAIDLAQYYLNEAARLANAAQIPPAIAKAELLRKWLIESCPHDVIVPRDILQFGPNQLRDNDTSKGAISKLIETGWLAELDAGTVVRGKARRKAYRIEKG